MKPVQKLQQGFTLIELMIVVAIIGIIAALAIPAYQDYTARAQMAEAFTIVDGAKTGVAVYAQENGVFPPAMVIGAVGGAGVIIVSPIAGKFSDAVVAPATGVITVTMKAAGTVAAGIAAKTVTFTPPALAGLGATFTWTCTSTAEQKYLPKSCTGV